MVGASGTKVQKTLQVQGSPFIKYNNTLDVARSDIQPQRQGKRNSGAEGRGLEKMKKGGGG